MIPSPAGAAGLEGETELCADDEGNERRKQKL